MPSFDAVSEVNLQEVDNAVNQARKEIENRYDFKGSRCSYEFSKEEPSITMLADDNMKLKAMTDILSQKMAKRGVGLRSLDYKPVEEAGGGTLRQKIVVKQGIETDDARMIVKLVKELGLKKVQAQIQDNQVRVTGPKRDDLQGVIQALKSKVTTIELQFTNFRD